MLAATLPITATPSAPPNSRTVSFTADPTPARAGGSVDMIKSVAVGIAMPAPRPNSNSPSPVGTYDAPSISAACTATRTVVTRIRTVARDGAIAALQASRPGKATVNRVERTELVEARAEISRLERTVIEQAVELGVLRGKSGWG